MILEKIMPSLVYTNLCHCLCWKMRDKRKSWLLSRCYEVDDTNLCICSLFHSLQKCLLIFFFIHSNIHSNSYVEMEFQMERKCSVGHRVLFIGSRVLGSKIHRSRSIDPLFYSMLVENALRLDGNGMCVCVINYVSLRKHVFMALIYFSWLVKFFSSLGHSLSL